MYLRESQEEAAIGDGHLGEEVEHDHNKGTPVVHSTKQSIDIIDAP